jgi:hypothetical protein
MTPDLLDLNLEKCSNYLSRNSLLLNLLLVFSRKMITLNDRGPLDYRLEHVVHVGPVGI